VEGEAAEAGRPGLGLGGADADDAAADVDTDGPERDAAAPVPAAPAAARPGERLIKEGSVTIEVPADGFARGYARVVEAARTLGGSVVASTSSTTEDGGTAGSVTVRVPVERYEDLLLGLGDIGEVRRQDIRTRDVTGEYTDLESRLRHARAQERFYLGLLEEAQSVGDAIAVQQQLDGIQQTIEQLQGRLNLLEDQTSFSTLTVELVEPGTTPVLAGAERPRLAQYLETARDAFVTVIGSLVVVAVAVAPLLALGLVGLLVWRSVHRGRRATVAVEP
jgi:hypothetical protein